MPLKPKIIATLVAFIFATQMTPASAQGRRQFLLTKDPVIASIAKAVCYTGFHMASLWEIFDVSNLDYSSFGYTNADSGSGPPSTVGGWVRTGYFASNSSTNAGMNNCNAWSTTTGMGTYAFLRGDWDNSSPSNPLMFPWGTRNSSCASKMRVWCIQDLPQP